MSPFSAPVLGGAALVSAPALWQGFVSGTVSTDDALIRYLVSVAICWLLLAFVTELVGPTPRPEPAQQQEEPAAT